MQGREPQYSTRLIHQALTGMPSVKSDNDKRSEIMKAESIDDILDILKSKSLSKEGTYVFIDFDLTIADIEPEMMSQRNSKVRTATMKEMQDMHRDDAVASAFLQAKYVLLEGENTRQLIKHIQNDFQAFIFTARRTGKPKKDSPETNQDNFFSILKQLNIDFSQTLPSVKVDLRTEGTEEIENLSLFPFEEPGGAMFDQGTLFSNNIPKGNVLSLFLNFLKDRGHCISTIICIDDNEENLHHILNNCLGIDAICIHYTAALQKKYTLDSNVIDIQKAYLLEQNKLLTDEEAKDILSSRTYDNQLPKFMCK